MGNIICYPVPETQSERLDPFHNPKRYIKIRIVACHRLHPLLARVLVYPNHSIGRPTVWLGTLSALWSDGSCPSPPQSVGGSVPNDALWTDPTRRLAEAGRSIPASVTRRSLEISRFCFENPCRAMRLTPSPPGDGKIKTVRARPSASFFILPRVPGLASNACGTGSRNGSGKFPGEDKASQVPRQAD